MVFMVMKKVNSFAKKVFDDVSNDSSNPSSKGKSRANDKDIIIELRDVWKTYTMGENKVHALRNLNLKVRKGEFLAVMGPSGSGKSTIMNMIGCLDVPTSGRIFLDGQDISLMSESNLAQIRGKIIGFIFQKFNLINSMTARENVMLPLTFQDMSESLKNDKAEKFLNLVGLGDRIEHTPNELSGGQQQRVAIARALANDPVLILADEPTGNLDSQSGKTVLEFLETLHKEKNTTIVLVTHDEKVGKRAERLVYLKDGLVVDNLDVDTSKLISKLNVDSKKVETDENFKINKDIKGVNKNVKFKNKK